MLWILEKKQKNQFNFTEYCISECSSLITCLASINYSCCDFSHQDQ